MQVIWSNYWEDINSTRMLGESWEDYKKYNDIDDDVDEFDYLVDLGNWWMDDLRESLRDYKQHNQLIGLADLGLWSGRVQGYKLIDGLDDITYSDCDYLKIYIKYGNVRSVGAHHDGTNYVIWREFKDFCTDEQIEHFTELIYMGKAKPHHVNYYTQSIAPIFKSEHIIW